MAGLNALMGQPPGAPQMEAAPQQPGMEPAMEPGAAMAGGGADPNVSPEEQAQYEQFVTQAMNMIYDEQISPKIVESLSTAMSPAEGLGRTLAMVVMRVEDAARDQGVEFQGDVMLHAAEEILEQLVEMGEAAGVKEYAPEDMEAALYFGLDTYRSTRQQEGLLSTDELTEDFQMLMEADQRGEVDSILPGVSAYAQGVEVPDDMDMQQEGPR